MPFVPIRLYKRHDLSLNKLSLSDMTLNSASSISIGSQHIAEKEEAEQGGIYNRLTLEVPVQGSCLMEIDASRQAFGFARDVIGSTRRCTIIDKFIVIVLKCIMTPSFVSLDMFHV